MSAVGRRMLLGERWCAGGESVTGVPRGHGQLHAADTSRLRSSAVG